jgi:hypothetical protein
VACPGFRFQLPGGQFMRRQNTTTIEVNWTVASGKSMQARACIIDASGSSGACASSPVTQAGPFSGFTPMDSTNLAFWSSGKIGGSFDQWDVPFIDVIVEISEGAFGSYYIAGSD